MTYLRWNDTVDRLHWLTLNETGCSRRASEPRAAHSLDKAAGEHVLLLCMSSCDGYKSAEFEKIIKICFRSDLQISKYCGMT